MIKAQSRYDGVEPSWQIIDPVGARESQPSVLHDVVGVDARTENTSGEDGQAGPFGVKIDHFHFGHIILTWWAIEM